MKPSLNDSRVVRGTIYSSRMQGETPQFNTETKDKQLDEILESITYESDKNN